MIHFTVGLCVIFFRQHPITTGATFITHLHKPIFEFLLQCAGVDKLLLIPLTLMPFINTAKLGFTEFIRLVIVSVL